MLWNQSAPCGETCSKKSWAKCSQIDGAVSPSRKHPLGQEPQQLRARIEEWESTGHSKTLIRTLDRQRTFIEGLLQPLSLHLILRIRQFTVVQVPCSAGSS